MHMHYIELPLFKLLAEVVEIRIENPGRNRGTYDGSAGVHWNRPANEGHITIMGSFFGAGRWQYIFYVVPHTGKILAQREKMAVHAAGVHIIVWGNLYNLHTTVS